MGAKKGAKKNVLSIVPVDDTRKVSFVVKWTANGKSETKAFDSRSELFAHVRGLETFMHTVPDSILRVVSHNVTVGKPDA